MPDLSDLISRVEKASGPDRDLEAEIWLACTPGATRNKWSYVHKATGRECTVDETRDATDRLIIVPSFTTSIDAVLTLLPKGMEFELTNLYGVAAVGMGLNTGSPCYARREDGNITLALLSAILRARQAMQMEART